MRNLVFLIAVILFSAVLVNGAVKTWDGGGVNNNWQTAANWENDIAPVANDDLVFPASAAQFTTNNNFFLFTSFRSITIDGDYIINGNPFRLTNGLTINSGTTQAINTGVTLSASQNFTSAQGSIVTIVLLDLGSSNLRIEGNGSFGIGLISGTGSLTKAGLGAALISSSANYSGQIVIENGILIVDANLPNSSVSLTNINPLGGSLGGTGTIREVNSLRGNVSAGTLTSPTGIFNITSGFVLSPETNFLPKIAGTTPGNGGHDQLKIGGPIQLNNARLLPIPFNGFVPQIGDSFTIIDNLGSAPVGGIFLNAPEGARFGGALNTTFQISYLGGNGNDVVLTRVNRAVFDFDGDGKSDIAGFTPASGTWNELLSRNGNTATRQFGLGTDKITPADFDGDAQTDIAVFRPSSGIWYVLNSADSTVTIIQFGSNGDIPVPNDFDGDGRAELAVFRPSDGVWYQLRSLGSQFFAQQFGQNGDLPQMGDFDGDGIGDLAIYRPSEGSWYYFRSSDNSFTAFPFGIATDIPVPGDYDGDGTTDAAVFRATTDPNQPDFYILRSSDLGFQGVSWGLPNDVPVIADYDGDGTTDIGVFRPATNDWYLLKSTEGFSAVNFGQNGDVPIPTAFIR